MGTFADRIQVDYSVGWFFKDWSFIFIGMLRNMNVKEIYAVVGANLACEC